MDRINRIFTVSLILVFAAAACSGKVGEESDAGENVDADEGDADMDAGADTDSDTAPDAEEDIALDEEDAPDPGGDASEDTVDDVCVGEPLAINPRRVRFMLLLDQSFSMFGEPWEQARNALESLVTNIFFRSFHYGLDAFPDGYPGDWADCDLLCMAPACDDDRCGTLFPPQVPVNRSFVSGPAILEHMYNARYPQLCTSTPLVSQLAYYDTGPGPTDAPEMYEAQDSNFLVVISDGEDDGCFEGDAVEALAQHTQNILETHGIRTFAVGFGTTTGVMADQLNAIASNGGTDFDTFLDAEDEEGLTEALDSIASSATSCRIRFDSPGMISDPGMVNIYFDGVAVPHDPDCEDGSGDGWNWSGDDYRRVELCGDYCDSIMADEVESITSDYGCPTVTD